MTSAATGARTRRSFGLRAGHAQVWAVSTQGAANRSGRGPPSASGDILASVLDRSPRKRSVLVLATFPTREIRTGEIAAGSVFALCR